MCDLISVIIPIYNAIEYLPICIDSIINQSYKNFEIILVDDGSSDGSSQVCDHYSISYDNISSIHQQNGGVTLARANGVSAAKGKWICFVDADDTMTNDALEIMYDATLKFDTDIVIAQYKRTKHYENVINISDYRSKCLLGTTISPVPWARLFRKTLFNNNIFDLPREIVYGEDMLMNIRLAFSTVLPVVELPQVVYHYRLVTTGASKTFSRNIAYTEKFHKLRVESIPKDEIDKYRDCLIVARLRAVTVISVSSPSNLSFLNSDFVSELKNDIKCAGFSIPLVQRLFLYVKIPVIRWLISRFFVATIHFGYKSKYY